MVYGDGAKEIKVGEVVRITEVAKFKDCTHQKSADTFIRGRACVRSVSYVVKVNGHLSREFRPERGLRQCDPLSPYLFFLCTEVLSAKVSSGLLKGDLSGVKISRSASVVTQLFFADDSIFFMKATSDEAQTLKRILSFYEDIYGKRINFDKSEIPFRTEIIGVLDVH
ncbi:hypothetical protein QQ045_006177 [Rhodiola kirilowii]